jgi:hypothetical protein
MINHTGTGADIVAGIGFFCERCVCDGYENEMGTRLVCTSLSRG